MPPHVPTCTYVCNSNGANLPIIVVARTIVSLYSACAITHHLHSLQILMNVKVPPPTTVRICVTITLVPTPVVVLLAHLIVMAVHAHVSTIAQLVIRDDQLYVYMLAIVFPQPVRCPHGIVPLNGRCPLRKYFSVCCN